MDRAQYPYTEQLKQLESFPAEVVPVEKRIWPELYTITTPLILKEWVNLLSSHPDAELSHYVLTGLAQGFHIGFDRVKVQCVRAKNNMQSALQHPSVVEDYLQNEIALGRVIGPVFLSRVPSIQINRFGVIPKNHQPGKWRLIVDLSDPAGFSINDGIDRELCSLKYVSVDDAVRSIVDLGLGTLIAKLDIESAYRIVPVHPAERLLLAMSWKGQVYIDTVLPFGLRLAPLIFTAVADAVQWILETQGVNHIMHYLDDYLVMGSPNSPECQRSLETILHCCQRLGVPIAQHKTEGPSTQLVFLSIELNTREGILRLPEMKLKRLQGEIKNWTGKQSCTKRGLLSLIGQLQHACCVVQPGRTFLRRMIDLFTTAKKLHHHVQLNEGFRSDLYWWACFLPKWNGVSMMRSVVGGPCHETITPDASGSWGCGTYLSTGLWLQLKWPRSWADHHITVKEMLPIVLAIAIWGAQWQGKTVRCRCDNAAVVAAVKSGWCKNNHAMHLLRCLYFFQAAYQVKLMTEHIKGSHNKLADATSRNNSPKFLSMMTSAQQVPVAVHPHLKQVLVDRPVDWTSQAWRTLLSTILPRD